MTLVYDITNRTVEYIGDGRALTGSRFLWLYGVENVPQHRWRDFETIRARAKKTARAWSLKETLRELWRQPSIDLAVSLWRRWYAWARRSRLEAVKKVALTVNSHIANILTYYRHAITNCSRSS